MTQERSDLSGIYVVNAMPLIADVVSGSAPRPRLRAHGESVEAWARQSPAWRHVERLGAVVAEPVPEGAARAFAELDCNAGAMAVGGAWIGLNEDGTRVAVLQRIPTVSGSRCLRCNHAWLPRSARRPVVCPACKSPYWATSRHHGSPGASDPARSALASPVAGRGGGTPPGR